MATNNWWEGNQATPVNPLTGQTDYLASLSPSVDIASAANTVGNLSAAPTTWDGISSWLQNSGILGTTSPDGIKTQGWGSPALSLASGLGSAYFGAQQLALAKDSLKAQKDQFAQNYAAQQKTTNASLADRQNARVASNPNAYASTADYMAKYGI